MCEIDIRTLTSHQVFGQILEHIIDKVLGQKLDQIFDQVLDQGFWTRKYSVQFYWDRKYTVQFDWDRNRLHANYCCLFRTYQTTGYPLSIANIAKRYDFVNEPPLPVIRKTAIRNRDTQKTFKTLKKHKIYKQQLQKK